MTQTVPICVFLLEHTHAAYVSPHRTEQLPSPTSTWKLIIMGLFMEDSSPIEGPSPLHEESKTSAAADTSSASTFQ